MMKNENIKQIVGGKPVWVRYAIAAALVMLIEIFLWNRSFWLSLGHEPIEAEEVFTQTGELLSFDEDFYLESGSFLEIREIDQAIKNIYVNIETDKEERLDVLKIRFQMADEGRKAYYSTSSRVISSRLQKLDYISLYPYGDLKSLRIEFPGEENTTVCVKDLVLNPRVPMFFSVWRVVLMYLLYLIGRALFFRPYLSFRQSGERRQRGIAVGLCVLTLAFVLPLTLAGDDANGRRTMDKYTDMTHALAQGMVSLDIEVDERLLAADNPYDSTELSELGISGYQWDYAYFDGKLYVYFGVVPVVLTYLPYFLLTGQDLPHIAAYLIFLLPLIVGAYLLLDALVKRFCSRLPEKLYYLFLVTFTLGIGTLIFAKRVCIYNLAIMSAVCFTVWGLYLWLSSVKENGQCVIWKVLLGSVCMALVAGCRPQLLMGSFLALPVFGEKLKEMLADVRKKKGCGKHALFLAAFCIPYLVIALLLMWYNYARFGSPFDFGAAYNLTTNDMRFRGIHMARMIAGLWSFLFKLPTLDVEFPYLGTTWINTAYQGITIQESGIGGIFATNLILWPCFLLYRFRAKLREKKALLFAVVSLAGGVVIACADVQMAGVLTRYMADFAIFFYLASFVVIFTLLDGHSNKQAECPDGSTGIFWYKVLAVLAGITVIYCLLTILSPYVVGDYQNYQPVWYYHLKEIFGVLDI